MHVHSLLVILLTTHTLYVSAFPVDFLSDFTPTSGSLSSASPLNAGFSPTTLSMARRFNSTGSANVVKFDQARARALKQRGNQSGGGSPTNNAGFNIQATNKAVDYVVQVAVGTPPQFFNLLVDTGSSNTWIGAHTRFTHTNSTVFAGNLFSVQYGSGNVFGYVVEEAVSLGGGLNLYNQTIGVAILAKGFDGVDGILGIGPKDLTCGSVFPDTNKCFNTVTDTAWAENLLTRYLIGISFQPSTDLENRNGELTFGGVDRSKFVGKLHYTPLTTASPANKYVGIDQSIVYGPSNLAVLDPTAGILDTGTTLILLATDAFNRYKNITGAIADQDTGLLRITLEQYSSLQSLYFVIGGIQYELTANAQIWPRTLNSYLGGEEDAIYLIIADLGDIGGNGLDFINGMAFLERYYMVYDIGNSRAGLAANRYTTLDIN